MRPKVPANVSGKPEPVEAEGDQLQKSTANDQTPESAVPSGKLHRRRNRGTGRRGIDNGSYAHFLGMSKIRVKKRSKLPSATHRPLESLTGGPRFWLLDMGRLSLDCRSLRPASSRRESVANLTPSPAPPIRPIISDADTSPTRPGIEAGVRVVGLIIAPSRMASHARYGRGRRRFLAHPPDRPCSVTTGVGCDPTPW